MPYETSDIIWLTVLGCGIFVSVFMITYHGYQPFKAFIRREEARINTVLNQQLLLDVSPRVALWIIAAIIMLFGLGAAGFAESPIGFVIGGGMGAVIPWMIVNHLYAKRKRRLDAQIVDGTTSLASGVRAGLNLVQSLELVVKNGSGPLQQEMRQLMQEYNLGIDLNTAMHNASNRIGSSYYRLLFAAIQAHRDRGGDMGQSLDRIAESIREIQRLEGRLQALTAQGRAQARFMAIMPVVIFLVLWFIAPDDTTRLFTEPLGRFLVLVAVAMITVAFVWIKRIMAVDI